MHLCLILVDDPHITGWVSIINKLVVFQMQLYLCGNTYTCMCKNKPSKSYYGIMYDEEYFSACKEIYCIEEQIDHRATFPLGKLASREAGKQKHLANLLESWGEMKHLGKSCKCEYRQKQTHLQLAKCFAKIFVDVSKVVLR